jgi:transcriptional regulator
MHIAGPYKMTEMGEIASVVDAAPLASFVTSTADGLVATPLPMYLDMSEGDHGVLYGHLARANRQWRSGSTEGLAIFMGPDAYVTPSWYATKRETGKAVPTWNYVAVHAYGAVEYFEDEPRLLQVVAELTRRHEARQLEPWAVTDAPGDYIDRLLGAIVGIRMPVSRWLGKKKLDQGRSAADRAGVAGGLQESPGERDRALSLLIPQG